MPPRHAADSELAIIFATAASALMQIRERRLMAMPVCRPCRRHAVAVVYLSPSPAAQRLPSAVRMMRWRSIADVY